MQSQKKIVIVDALASASELPREFNRLGYACFHVQVSKVAYFANSLKREYFAECFVYDDNLDELVRIFKESEVIAVLAGMEPGVEVADQLAEALGLNGNGTRLSAARRDKYEMQEAVRSHGLDAAKQIKLRDAAACLAWIEQNTEFPIVVKPLTSMGSDGVTFCRGAADVQAVFASAIDQTNFSQPVNVELLCQEYLPGDEYVVDTVSFEGQHHTVGIWKYRKGPRNSGYFVYESMNLVDPESAESQLLSSYAYAVLDALAVKFGPGHAEIKLTPRGPVLVEVGTRLSGGIMSIRAKEALEHNQAELTADVYTTGVVFKQLVGRPYKKKQEMVLKFLSSDQEGVVSDLRQVDKIQALPSYIASVFKHKAGDRVSRTHNVFTMTGWVLLSSQTLPQLEDDLDFIRQVEGKDIYVCS